MHTILSIWSPPISVRIGWYVPLSIDIFIHAFWGQPWWRPQLWTMTIILSFLNGNRDSHTFPFVSYIIRLNHAYIKICRTKTKIGTICNIKWEPITFMFFKIIYKLPPDIHSLCDKLCLYSRICTSDTVTKHISMKDLLGNMVCKPLRRQSELLNHRYTWSGARLNEAGIRSSLILMSLSYPNFLRTVQVVSRRPFSIKSVWRKINPVKVRPRSFTPECIFSFTTFLTPTISEGCNGALKHLTYMQNTVKAVTLCRSKASIYS